MKTRKTCYLPAHNAQTSRLEFVAFCTLCLAGVALISMSMTNALHFVQNREAIVQAWSPSERPVPTELARRTSDQALTNFLRVHAAKAPTYSDLSHGAPASAGSEVLMPQCQLKLEGATQRWKIEALQ